MKRHRRLRLARETIRSLVADELAAVGGGNELPTCITNAPGCPGTFLRPCVSVDVIGGCTAPPTM